MSGQEQVSGDSGGEVELWDPREMVSSIEVREARLANGFLRSHPERWFPGFAERWAPLLSTLGCEVRIVEIKPTLVLPDTSWLSFRGALEEEALLIAVEPHTAEKISEEVVPHLVSETRQNLLVEYVIQRFMAVLGMTQTLSETAGGVVFQGRCSVDDVPVVAGVRFSLTLNAVPCVFIVALGQELVDRMDRLWRRQVHSSVRTNVDGGALRFELAQLGVPPSVLSEYVRKGTVIDLEVPVSDAMTLRVGSRVFMPARLVSIDGMLGCQTMQGTAEVLTVPEGTARLSIELASVSVDHNMMAELGQVGAVLNTGQPLSSRVVLSINQERVAEGRLGVFHGRYAVEVL